MRSRCTVFDAEPGGWAEGVAEHAADHHPMTITAGVLLAGYLALTAVMLTAGAVLTRLLLGHGVGAWDRDATTWLVDHRTSVLNHVTEYATFVANTEPVVAVTAAVTLLLLLRHRWREVIFLMGGLGLELPVFLTVNFAIHRPRPAVPRLNATPATSSFPSGHAAASIVLWVGLALTVSVVTTNLVVRVIAWLPVVTLPPTVAFARVYRGMHNPTDVVAGVLLGAMALGVACFAARVWSAATSRSPVPTPAEDGVELAPVGAR